MDNGFMWLAITELIVIVVIVGIRLIFNYIEHRKIKYVLDYMAKNLGNKKDIETNTKENENTGKMKSTENIKI